jgi:NitT/TauT family transport system permease protein
MKNFYQEMCMLIKLRPIIIVFSILIFWQGLVMILRLPPYILPTPIAVFKTMIAQWPLLLNQTWPTLVETLLGLFFGVAVGMLGALAMAYFQPIRFWLLPVLVISQALPTFAIAPLLVIWFGFGLTSKILVAGLVAFFPILTNGIMGFRNTDPRLAELMAIMGAKRQQIFIKLELPSSLPVIFGGLKLGITLSVIGAVVGEFSGAGRGLGYLVNAARGSFDTPLIFVALIALALLGISFYLFICWLEYCLLPWRRRE